MWQKQFLTKALRYGLIGLLLIGGLESCAPIYSDPGRVWVKQASPFVTSSVQSVAYGNGKWVSGGVGGKLAYSTDGETWTLVASSPFTLGYSVYGIAYGNGRWIASCGFEIAYSTNGETWTIVSPTPFAAGYLCNSIAYGNGAWVATGSITGSGGWTAYSDDGETWTLVSTPQLGASPGISSNYGNGRWLIAGQDGKIVHSYSADTWNIEAISPYGEDGYYTSAAYSDDQKRWIVVGYLYSDNSGIIITSDYLESGMGFTSRTVDDNEQAYYSLQDGAAFYPSLGLGGKRLARTSATAGPYTTGSMYTQFSAIVDDEETGETSIPRHCVFFLAVGTNGTMYPGIVWRETATKLRMRYGSSMLELVSGGSTSIGFTRVFV